MLRTNIFFRSWMVGRCEGLEKRIPALQAMIGRSWRRLAEACGTGVFTQCAAVRVPEF